MGAFLERDGLVGIDESDAKTCTDSESVHTQTSGISQHPTAQAAQSLLAAIVDSSDDAIVSKTLDGIITSWNKAATRMFGYAAEEIIGQSILRLIPEDLHHEEDMILAKLRAGERIDHYETVRVRKNGDKIDVSVTISPIRDKANNIIGASKVARDISERKRIERSLVEAEKLAAIGRMAATVAHEINNPLEALINLVFLARTSDSIKQVRTYLQTAEKELERVSHLARQTLGYYRHTGAPVEVDLRKTIESVLTVYEGRLASRNISVECEFKGHGKIVARREDLIQAVSNIIANSIDAMPRGGTIHIYVDETRNSEARGVRIVIRDEGTGIPEGVLARVFDPFVTTKGDLGTGIGLWVVKQLIERQHGQITITSKTDPAGSGTNVSIFLPFLGTTAVGTGDRTN